MPSHQENVIREHRTNLATKNNLMGPSGKFGVILRAFGHPVVRQGTGMFDSTGLEDPFEDYSANEYSPTLSGQTGPLASGNKMLDAPDENVHEEAVHFDGLSRGMHLEIKMTHHENEMVVTYKGYTVYKEVAGELEAYAPFPEWETLIEKLYRAAKDRIAATRAEDEEAVGRLVQQKKAGFLERLRMRWGI